MKIQKNELKIFSKIATIASLSTALSAILNFFYNVFVGRFLGPEKFGLLASLISIVGILTIGSSGFQVATARAIATNKVTKKYQMFDNWTKKTLFIGLVSFFVLLVLAFFIGHLLNTSYLTASSISISGLSALIFAISIGRLQGSNKIIEWQFWGIFATFLKLSFAGFLIFFNASLGFFVVSLSLIAIFTSLIILYRTKNLGSVQLKVLSHSVLTSSVSMALLWFITQVDISIVRIKYSETEAGLFAAASTISKSIPLAVGLIGAILLPIIAKKNHERESTDKDIKNLALTSLILSSIMSLIAILISQPLMLALFGSKFIGSENYLWKLAVTSIPWAIAMSLVQARLGSHSGQVSVILLISTVIQVVSFVFLAKSIDQIIIISGVVATILIILIFSISNSKIGVK